MKWDDLNLDRAVWRVPQASGAPAHTIPLPAQLVGLLQQLPKVERNPYVFIGEVAGGHLVNIKRAWQRIRVKAEITDVRIQDLRRTFGAWLTASGESLALIGQVLNHRSPVTTAGYVSLKLDPIREALERNSKRMILGGGKIGPAFAKSKTASLQPNPLLVLTAPESQIKKNEE